MTLTVKITNQKSKIENEEWLPDMDLNHDKQIQSLLCYRYTIGQTGAGDNLMSPHLESSRHSPVPRRACKSAFVQPQRGCGFRPKVGAKRLPWVNGEGKVSQPQRGCATPSDIGHNPVGVVQNFCTPAPKVAFGATLGFRSQPRWG